MNLQNEVHFNFKKSKVSYYLISLKQDQIEKNILFFNTLVFGKI